MSTPGARRRTPLLPKNCSPCFCDTLNCDSTSWALRQMKMPRPPPPPVALSSTG
jgi:hypothetical protein